MKGRARPPEPGFRPGCASRRPSGLPSSIVPPLASARSRRPSRPEPDCSTAPPTPLSAISSRSTPLRGRRPHLDQRGVRVLLRVGDRLGDDVVADRLGRRRSSRSDGSSTQVDLDARMLGEALDRLGEAEIDQHRGMDAVRELPQLVDRKLQLLLGLLSSSEPRRRRLGSHDPGRVVQLLAPARSGAAAPRRGGRARAGAARCRKPRSRAPGKLASREAKRSRSLTTAARLSVESAATAMKSCVLSTLRVTDSKWNGPW